MGPLERYLPDSLRRRAHPRVQFSLPAMLTFGIAFYGFLHFRKPVEVAKIDVDDKKGTEQAAAAKPAAPEPAAAEGPVQVRGPTLEILTCGALSRWSLPI